MPPRMARRFDEFESIAAHVHHELSGRTEVSTPEGLLQLHQQDRIRGLFERDAPFERIGSSMGDLPLRVDLRVLPTGGKPNPIVSMRRIGDDFPGHRSPRRPDPLPTAIELADQRSIVAGPPTPVRASAHASSTTHTIAMRSRPENACATELKFMGSRSPLEGRRLRGEPAATSSPTAEAGSRDDVGFAATFPHRSRPGCGDRDAWRARPATRRRSRRRRGRGCPAAPPA